MVKKTMMLILLIVLVLSVNSFSQVAWVEIVPFTIVTGDSGVILPGNQLAGYNATADSFIYNIDMKLFSPTDTTYFVLLQSDTTGGASGSALDSVLAYVEYFADYDHGNGGSTRKWIGRTGSRTIDANIASQGSMSSTSWTMSINNAGTDHAKLVLKPCYSGSADLSVSQFMRLKFKVLGKRVFSIKSITLF
jgi:hypothetical protein